MIPKILHCCWFGGPKTRLARKCRASWARFAPDWEIREWSELNFPIDEFPYASAAAKERRWAVVSDVARYWCLKEFGGVYLDMDVELVAPIDDLVAKGPFLATEVAPHEIGVESPNPGSGLALAKGSVFAQSMLTGFSRQSYDSNVEMMGLIRKLVEESLKKVHEAGEEIQLLPASVFSPIQPDGSLRRTSATRGIHWYAMSGYPLKSRIARWLAWHGLEWVLELARKCR